MMRFFTPQRYLRFNSDDDAVADRANEDWENTIRDYATHLQTIRGRMTPAVKHLADICLHDAELKNWTKEILPQGNGRAPWYGVAVMTLQQHDTITTLIYNLWDRVREKAPSRTWPFSSQRVHWLYDEIDICEHRRGGFWHRILLSDGRVIAIPFTKVILPQVMTNIAQFVVRSRKSAG